jgi:hypothetical protein
MVAISLRAVRGLTFAFSLLLAGCAGPDAECVQAKREAAKLWGELDYAKRAPPERGCADTQRQIDFLKGQLGSLQLLLQAVHNADESRARADADRMKQQASFLDELDALQQESARACGSPGSAKCATAIRDAQRIEKSLACMTHVEAACVALCKATEPGMPGPSAMSSEHKTQLSIVGCLTLGEMYLAGEGVPRNQPASVEMYDRACVLGSQDGCTMRDRARP